MDFQPLNNKIGNHLTAIAGSHAGLYPWTDDGKNFSVYCNELEGLRMFYYYRNHPDKVRLRDISYKNFGPHRSHLFEVLIEE